MDQIVVAGIETAVGANLASGLGIQATVTGVVTAGPALALPNCDIVVSSDATTDGLRRILQRTRPARLVVCGPGAVSCWDEALRPSAADVQQTRNWIDAAAAENVPLTIISSDAVFTGPWMFHPETSHSWCQSPEAAVLRQLEHDAQERSPQALILRTHAFGWTPGNRTGWLERALDRLAAAQPLDVDGSRHATPILASDLAEFVVRAWAADLIGVYHLAGAERISPAAFLRKLAVQFALPQPQIVAAEALDGPVQGYGRGETSLQTRRLRRALGTGMPLVTEGIQRLYQQQISGHRAALQHSASRPNRVA